MNTWTLLIVVGFVLPGGVATWKVFAPVLEITFVNCFKPIAALPDTTFILALSWVKLASAFESRVFILVVKPSIWVWTALVTPSRWPNSVEVTSETATLPDPLETKARDTVKSASSIVVAEKL